ncbi:TATDN3, partial [Symbiodinium pilosum]
IGLDFSRPLIKQKAAARGTTEADVRASQIAVFEAHLQLAKELDLPVNVHSRNAEKEVLNILARKEVWGVLHAYKGPAALAVQAAQSRRLWFSFPPSLVYKWEYQEAVKALPLEYLLLETDSPSLAAAGPKARNEPGFIRAAAKKMAQLKGVSIEEVASRTTQNAVRLFGKASPNLQACTVKESENFFTGKTQRWQRDLKDKRKGELPAPPPAQAFVPPDRPRRRWSRQSHGIQELPALEPRKHAADADEAGHLAGPRRVASRSEGNGRLQQTAIVTTLTLALAQKVKGRRRHTLSAGPRFAPEQPPKEGEIVVSGGPARLARKKVPRWAPDGGSDPLVADKGRGGALDFMTEEVYPGDGRCYRVVYDLGIGMRKEPNIGAKRTGEDLLAGEVFEIKQEIRRAGRRYFELLDGRGWVFDWTEIDGERVELVELAAQLYTVAFPDGVNGIAWSSDATMRFCTVNGFTNEVEATNLAQAGIRTGDVLVMIDQDPVVGMPFGQVLERVWATGGRQPGSGYFYKVTTESPYGIGIRDEPDINGPRTGEDLIRGAVFEVDEMVEVEDELTYLHLADQRGWVFDNSAVDPENPCVINLAEIEPGCTLTMWRGEVDELAKTIGLRFKQDGNEGQPFTLTVLEEGEPIQRVPCAPGSNLRKTLLANGFQVYQDLRSVFNCNAQQLCGTCVLDVMEGDDNLTVRSVNEAAVMSANPPSFRLCCNIDVYGDVTVRLRPRGVKYGGGTS